MKVKLIALAVCFLFATPVAAKPHKRDTFHYYPRSCVPFGEYKIDGKWRKVQVPR